MSNTIVNISSLTQYFKDSLFYKNLNNCETDDIIEISIEFTYFELINSIVDNNFIENTLELRVFIIMYKFWGFSFIPDYFYIFVFNNANICRDVFIICNCQHIDKFVPFCNFYFDSIRPCELAAKYDDTELFNIVIKLKNFLPHKRKDNMSHLKKSQKIAIMNNKFNFLKFLMDNNYYKYDVLDFNDIIMNNSFECLTLIIDYWKLNKQCVYGKFINYNFNQDLLHIYSYAIKCDNIKCIKYLFENGFILETHTIYILAITEKSFNIFNYLISSNKKYFTTIHKHIDKKLHKIRSHNSLLCLFDNGFSFKEIHYDCAIDYGNIVLFEFLHKIVKIQINNNIIQSYLANMFVVMVVFGYLMLKF